MTPYIRWCLTHQCAIPEPAEFTDRLTCPHGHKVKKWGVYSTLLSAVVMKADINIGPIILRRRGGSK